ncbi:MAG: ABC transporter permease [Leucobacter sp.]
MTESTGTAPPAAAAVNPHTSAPGFWRGTRLVAALELRQRLRSRALLVLVIVWFALIGTVTWIAWGSLSAAAHAFDGVSDGFPLFSIIVYFVLLFGTLVAPAVSAASIGAERGQATLATTQVTLISTWSLLIGKALAAWLTGIAFLVAATPFVVFSLIYSKAGPAQLLLALLALALQIGVFTIIGVGLSAAIRSQVFAIVMAYLVVALLSVGTLIAFGLAAGITTRYVEVEVQTTSETYDLAVEACENLAEEADDVDACYESIPLECEASLETMSYTPTHTIWWLLALNPYVVVADMVPPQIENDYPTDLFGSIAYGVRDMQRVADQPTGWDECSTGFEEYVEPDSTATVFDRTVPVWWIGFGLQVLLAAAALWAGRRTLDTPARKLPRGSRIA